MSKKRPAFEEALKQLETIAEQIERGEIGLEESIQKYEEGMGLVRHCRDVLTRAEMKIQELQQRADGTLEAVDFVPPAEIRGSASEAQRTRSSSAAAAQPPVDAQPLPESGEPF